jgi:hypothetical protein
MSRIYESGGNDVGIFRRIYELQLKMGSDMTFKCEIKIHYKNKEAAKAVADSIKIDDYGYASTDVVGNTIVSTIGATTLRGLLRSVDDYLACASVSERVVRNIKDE